MLPLLSALAASSVASPTYTQSYADKSSLRVQLIGEGADVLRVTVFPPGTAAADAEQGYRDWMRSVAPSTSAGLSAAKGAAGTVLSTPRGIFELTVGKSAPTTKLSVNGAVVSEEVRPVSAERGAACLPPGWTQLDAVKGSSAGTMAATLSGTADESCLRHTRSLAPGEDLYGFGQVPQAGLSAVGDAKLLATSSRNQVDGPSHAPAPFYVSIQGKGVAHGFLLSTGRYSMFDLGNATKDEIRIHSPEKVMDYFLFVGPTPAAVIAQMTSISGRPPLPRKYLVQPLPLRLLSSLKEAAAQRRGR